MKKFDLFLVIILIACLIFFISFYYLNQINKCASNPLVYSANYYKERYGDVQVVGNLFILGGKKGVIIEFNTTSSQIIND